MIKEVTKAVLFFIPRFVTEDVAVMLPTHGHGFELVCSMDALEDDEVYDGVVTVTSFVWLWFGLTQLKRGAVVRPWPTKVSKPEGR